MSETQKTTNRISDILTSIQSIEGSGLVLHSVLSESSSFPHNVEGENIRGISVSNNSAISSIQITLTDENDTSIILRVSSGKNFECTTNILKSINTSDTSNFDIALFMGA